LKSATKQIGLRASRPNEYLHIDTTFLTLSTGKKVCITVVMDNFSRMVLGYDMAETLSFCIVKGALQNALITISKHPVQSNSILVTDGGRENNNQQIESFLQSLTDFQLTKVRALKDILFSNSPIEAIHRILKGRYLRNQKFDRVEKLKQCLDEAVIDYNELRPHCRHSPRTPKEVYFGIPLTFDVSKRMRKAARQRIIKNKASACTICTKINMCPVKLTSPRLTTTYGTP
jgi:putative transposase